MTTYRRRVPRNYRAHPNLFIANATNAFAHLALGLDGVLLYRRHQLPIYSVSNLLFPYWVWGVLHLCVAGAMIGGLARRPLLRNAILASILTFLTQGSLMLAGAVTAGTTYLSPIFFYCFAALAYVTYREPPINPANTRIKGLK